MSEYKRQIIVGGVVAFVLGVMLIAGAISGTSSTSTSTSSSIVQQTTTSLETTQLTTVTNTDQFVLSPETVETTNSTLGLELSLSVSSTIVSKSESY